MKWFRKHYLISKKAAAGKENVIPYLLRSVEEYASVGEISDALREVWGVYE